MSVRAGEPTPEWMLDGDPQEQAARRARTRRQGIILLAITNALVLAVGTTAMVDLRRLETPGGTALRWVQAALFGDCGDYLKYSVAGPDRPEPRHEDQVCADLRAATTQARDRPLEVGLRLVAVQGTRAELVITRLQRDATVFADVTRVDGDWKVVRNAFTCGSVGCA